MLTNLKHNLFTFLMALVHLYPVVCVEEKNALQPNTNFTYVSLIIEGSSKSTLLNEHIQRLRISYLN